MRYKSALFDGSDPGYAPGLNWSGRYAYWKPTRKYVDLGHPKAPIRLPGTKGDGRDAERAAEARRLTRAMIENYQPDEGPEPGTWSWVIRRWKEDAYSRYNTCGANTRADYDYRTKKWDAIIGHMQIDALTYDQINIIRRAMDEKEYSDSLMQKLFGMLRHLARYALGPLQQKQTRDLVDVLGEMRFRSPAKKATAPTREQVRAVIDEADARGMFAFATGILFQWTYALRAVDVRGQWLPADGEGGIVRDGKRWQDGLTWDMFDKDLTEWGKVISKTQTPVEGVRLTPELRCRLRLLRNVCGTGPVIVSERLDAPYTKHGWSRAFRRIRDDLKIPDTVKMMDTRAGALTEAKNLGVDPFALRDLGTHAHVSTTDGYARGRSENINKVVELRGRK